MKKIISIILAAALLLSGCSDKDKTIQHGRKENTTVIFSLPGGEIIEGCPDWVYFEDETVSVQIDGVTYRVSRDSFAMIVEVD